MLRPSASAQPSGPEFDLQGHRGARGLFPENTIPAFRHALELGVRTLELDVVISADREVVVSHDPVMSTTICSQPDGRPVDREIRLFELRYEEIALFDCGSRGNPAFPRQERVSAPKPLLREVIAMEREVSAKLGREPARWNIETKSTPDGDGFMHPAPEEFVRLLLSVLVEGQILDRTVIQSFDHRTLREVRTLEPGVALSLLVDRNRVGDWRANKDALGFTPEIYSPHHGSLSAELVTALHAAGMLVVPWTVNDPLRMKVLMEMGVDGIITDYPDRALPLLPR